MSAVLGTAFGAIRETAPETAPGTASCAANRSWSLDLSASAGRRPGRFGSRGASGGKWAMRLLLRFMGFLFTAGTIVFLVGVAAAAGLLWHYSKDLPDYSQLENYEPAVMTRVHAADGSLLAEY